MRKCKKCGETKPFTDYYKQKGCRDGIRPECKACHRRAGKQYREDNAEAYRARDNARNNTPERRAAAIARARNYYADNHEHCLKVRREHYRANREKYLAYSAKRKALKRGAEHIPYTRTEIYERDNGMCRLCDKPLDNVPNGFSIDHIVPLALGGADTPANLQLTCQPCNRAKWMNLEGQIHFGC